MVICQYYQSGNCRFGTKCMNEHFDVHQIIKNEIEAALKGNQWPLSCFGPFKEIPCIPNFIEDQCFEEVRFMCYEAKAKQCFPVYQQQFNQQILDAQNKLNALLTLNREVVETVIQMYNSSDSGQKSGQVANPFGSGGNAYVQQGSLFGNSHVQANPFASTAFNNSQTQPSGGNLFSSKPAGESLFSQNSFGATPNSAFGGNVQNSGIGFSMNQIAQQNKPFGAPPAAATNAPFGNTNIFGQAANNNQAVPNAAFQQPGSGGNLFAQPQSQTQAGFGSFAQPQGQNLFGNQPAPNQTPFGGNQPQQTLFGNQQQTQSAFGFQQPQPGQQSNVFGVSTQQNIFETASATQAPQQQQQQQQPPNQMNAFSGNVFQNQNSGQPSAPFGAVNQQQQQQQQQQNLFSQAGANIFQQPAQQTQQQNIFTGAAGFNAAPAEEPIPDSVYSKMDQLSPEAIEAFKADQFVMGRIPTVPPPRELCN